jgi:hypothetical protein
MYPLWDIYQEAANFARHFFANSTADFVFVSPVF